MTAGKTARAAILSLTVTAAALVSIVAGAAASGARSDLEAIDISLVNGSRAENGLPAVALDSRLTAIAERHAAGLARHHALSHNTGLSRDVHRAGLCAPSVGENIAYLRSRANAESKVHRVHAMYMRSPSHRANILTPGFKLVGIGVVERGGAIWSVEDFAAPC